MFCLIKRSIPTYFYYSIHSMLSTLIYHVFNTGQIDDMILNTGQENNMILNTEDKNNIINRKFSISYISQVLLSLISWLYLPMANLLWFYNLIQL